MTSYRLHATTAAVGVLPFASVGPASATQGTDLSSVRSELSTEHRTETALTPAQIALGTQAVRREEERHDAHRAVASLPLLEIAFTAGFASIFIINGITAWVRPHDFVMLLGTFPMAAYFGHLDLMVVLAGINDVVVGLLILSRKWKHYVLAYAGVWLGLVSMIKLFSLF